MNINEDRVRVIFRRDVEDNKTYYSIGLSKKDKDGNYINGYINCRFPKEAAIENKQRIKIHEGWLDFYVKDKKTFPYVFINKYELIEDKVDIPQNVKSEYKGKDITLEDKDLPF